MIRPATEGDAAAIRRIQMASAEAAQWTASGYPTLVAEVDGAVCGFLMWLELPEREVEILNLAVHPECRRRGIARALIGQLMALRPSTVFLEVRAGNAAARNFYEVLGFKELTVRKGYYRDPPDAAVVMRLSS